MWSTERPASRNATVEVMEAAYEVAPGEDFERKVKEIAESKGIKNFKVYLNDREVGRRDAPRTFSAGDVVKIMSYDKAA